jgi:hypothetical protein
VFLSSLEVALSAQWAGKGLRSHKILERGQDIARMLIAESGMFSLRRDGNKMAVDGAESVEVVPVVGN